MKNTLPDELAPHRCKVKGVNKATSGLHLVLTGLAVVEGAVRVPLLLLTTGPRKLVIAASSPIPHLKAFQCQGESTEKLCISTAFTCTCSMVPPGSCISQGEVELSRSFCWRSHFLNSLFRIELFLYLCCWDSVFLLTKMHIFPLLALRISLLVLNLFLVEREDQGPTGRVFSISGGFGSGIEKKVGYRAGSDRVLVLKYSIGYFRVSYFLSGISG